MDKREKIRELFGLNGVESDFEEEMEFAVQGYIEELDLNERDEKGLLSTNKELVKRAKKPALEETVRIYDELFSEEEIDIIMLSDLRSPAFKRFLKLQPNIFDRAKKAYRRIIMEVAHRMDEERQGRRSDDEENPFK